MMDDWILGCDVCQEVCPWNRKAPLSSEAVFEPLDGHNPIDLRSLFTLSDEQFRARFRKTPLWRPKRRGILRNAAIALGNHPHPNNVAALGQGLIDEEPLIRAASAWALGRHPAESSLPLLEPRRAVESDSEVIQEINEAISDLSSNE